MPGLGGVRLRHYGARASLHVVLPSTNCRSGKAVAGAARPHAPGMGERNPDLRVAAQLKIVPELIAILLERSYVQLGVILSAVLFASAAGNA